METLRAFDDPGFAVKRWPAHTAMQPTIAAALCLHDPARPPRAIRITAPVLSYCNRPHPADGDAARFSFQFAAAAALLDGRIGHDTFSDARLADPALQQLLRCTELVLDPNIPVAFTRMHVEIEVDGERRASTDRWHGHWKQPATEEILWAKFHECVEPCLGEDGSGALWRDLAMLTEPGHLASVLRQLASAASVASIPGPTR
jgi:aconitate decarboxylase